MNKKGWIKMVEATIAIVLILGTLIFLSSHRQQTTTENPAEDVPSLLDELARNLTMREAIIENSDDAALEHTIALSLASRLENPSLNISVEVCKTDEVCFLDPYPDIEQEIFSYERIVSGSIRHERFEPKKLKVFVWRN